MLMRLIRPVCICVVSILPLPASATSTIIADNSALYALAWAEGGNANPDEQIISRPFGVDTWSATASATQDYIEPTSATIVDFAWSDADQNSTIASNGEYFYADGFASTVTFTDVNGFDTLAIASSYFEVSFSLDSTYNYSFTSGVIGQAGVSLNGTDLATSGILNPGAYTLIATADDLSTNGSLGTYSLYTFELTLTEVPIPAAVWLFGTGLLGLVGVARRKKA